MLYRERAAVLAVYHHNPHDRCHGNVFLYHDISRPLGSFLIDFVSQKTTSLAFTNKDLTGTIYIEMFGPASEKDEKISRYWSRPVILIGKVNATGLLTRVQQGMHSSVGCDDQLCVTRPKYTHTLSKHRITLWILVSFLVQLTHPLLHEFTALQYWFSFSLNLLEAAW